MSIQEEIQKSPVVYFLSAILAAFILGLGAYPGLLKMFNYKSYSPAEVIQLQNTVGVVSVPPPRIFAEDIEAANRLTESSQTGDYKENYQYDGYKADLIQLNSLVLNFLTHLQENPGATYPQVQSFYPAVIDAADTVTLKALSSFKPPTDQETPSYNWNVYVIPSKFIIQVRELRKQHVGGLSAQQIEAFRDRFKLWKQDSHF